MMREKRNFMARMFRHRLFLLFNFFLFVFLAVSFGREYTRNQQIQKSIASLEEQASRLEQRNIEIAQINSQLESESFLEQEARLRLGLVKEGERVVVISNEEQETVDIGGEAISDYESEFFPSRPLERWHAYFFDNELFDKLKFGERSL